MLNKSLMTNNTDHQLDSYQYELPQHLIASRPSQKRDHSRLLVYNQKTDQVSHHYFHELKNLLPEDAHLVLNSSKVYPCRLMGQKPTGGKCEIFLLSLGDEVDLEFYYHCLIKSRGKKEVGDSFEFDEYVKATIYKIHDDGTFTITFNLDHEYLLDYLERKALVPLPPYIRDGQSDEKDKKDYQTVYAKELGSVAAPTAGLHFTKELLESIDHSFVSLHVGLGTFKPVDTDDIRNYNIHSEYYSVQKDQLDRINQNKKNLFAVGTTSLRVLESSLNQAGEFEASPLQNETNIYLYPGKEVRSIKGMITNFHLPGSSLIMLVSAIIGREKTLELYKIAIENEYRFFSYGDAMLILRDDNV